MTTKTDLIASVAAKSEISKAEAERIINTFIEQMSADLGKNGQVSLRGFGKFERRVRPPTMRRNPQTGEPLPVPSITTVVFIPSPTLRREL